MTAPRVAIQIPMAARASTRLPPLGGQVVPNKLWRELGGAPVWTRLVLPVLELAAGHGWEVFFDTEQPKLVEAALGEHIDDAALSAPVFIHERNAAHAESWANGNHLLNQFAARCPDYDWYVQVNPCSAFLDAKTVGEMLAAVAHDRSGYDSALTVTRLSAMVWHDGAPANYDPRRMAGMPRTQDLDTWRVTHGCYATRGDVARRTGCLVGERPALWEVDEWQAFDLDTEADWAEALRRVKGSKRADPRVSVCVSSCRHDTLRCPGSTTTCAADNVGGYSEPDEAMPYER